MSANIPDITSEDDALFDKWFAETKEKRQEFEDELREKYHYGLEIPPYNSEIYKYLVLCSLKGKIKEWNSWAKKIKDRDEILINLSGAYLGGANLEGANLEGANLEGANLEGANLNKAHLEGANLNKAHLEGAQLKRAILMDAYLQEAHLEGAQLKEEDLEKAQLKEKDLDLLSLDDEDECAIEFLMEALIWREHLKETHLDEAVLIDAHLEGAFFEGAHLEKAHLEGAFLERSHLEGAHLEGAHLEKAHFNKAEFEDADFKKSFLRGTHFKKERILEKGANLEGANLEGADLEGADLKGANLEGVYLNGCELRKVDIRCTIFKLASVDGNTILEEPIYDEETDFTGVGLSSMRIEPSLKVSLEKNIRKLHWNAWYKYVLIKNDNKNNALIVNKNENISRKNKNSICSKYKEYAVFLVNILLNIFVCLPVRVFWAISDYGSSTKRVIGSFFGMNLGFAILYIVLTCTGNQTIIPDSMNFSINASNIATTYAQSTTLMFGITSGSFDYWALPWWVVLITFIHIMFGYLILAALITRFTIMFQNLSS